MLWHSPAAQCECWCILLPLSEVGTSKRDVEQLSRAVNPFCPMGTTAGLSGGLSVPQALLEVVTCGAVGLCFIFVQC